MLRLVDMFISMLGVWLGLSSLYENGLSLNVMWWLLFAVGYFRCSYRAFKYPTLK